MTVTKKTGKVWFQPFIVAILSLSQAVRSQGASGPQEAGADSSKPSNSEQQAHALGGMAVFEAVKTSCMTMNQSKVQAVMTAF